MPRLTVFIALPYGLRIRDGDYQTSAAGHVIVVRRVTAAEGDLTEVSADFEHPDAATPEEIIGFQRRDAEQLLRRTNRLLRWCRAVGGQAELVELTRAQGSPFHFLVGVNVDPLPWIRSLVFEAEGPTRPRPSLDEQTDAVRAGLASGGEPEVADLFLIDAEQAIREGRFREAVLFCWSTIDATSNRKYEALIDEALVDEWADARKFLTGVEFGLRNKMTAILHLVAGRSLFREPGKFWDRLGESYRKRNAIIHRGDGAAEDDARAALDVARRVVAVMRSI